MMILKMPVGTEENPLQPIILTSPADSLLTSVGHLETKINGRPTASDAQTQLAVVTEEAVGESCVVRPRNKSQQVLRIPERRSDEKIIAEILKPEERIRISKSSDNKLLKVTSTNTAISLD